MPIKLRTVFPKVGAAHAAIFPRGFVPERDSKIREIVVSAKDIMNPVLRDFILQFTHDEILLLSAEFASYPNISTRPVSSQTPVVWVFCRFTAESSPENKRMLF